jgi:trigger factor
MQKMRKIKMMKFVYYGVMSIIISVLCLLLMTGCSDTNDAPEDEEIVPPVIEQDEREQDEREQEVYLDYFTTVSVTEENIFRFVTLGNLRGIEFDTVTVSEVTESDVDEIIDEHLMVGAAMREISDRAALDGDRVLISYEGFIDGSLFQGGSDEETLLHIGSGQFIPGFEEQIIGRYTGENFEINVVFPDDYSVRELAGREAVFVVDLHSIHEVVPHELTDEFATEILGLDSIQHYRDAIRERLELDRVVQARDEEMRQVWMTVVADAIVHSFPVHELDDAVTRNLVPFQNLAENMDMELEPFVSSAFNISFDDFLDEYIVPGAISDVRMDLVLRAVATAEGITVTSSEIEEKKHALVDEFGLESIDELLLHYDETRIKFALLSEKVIEILMLHAVRVG